MNKPNYLKLANPFEKELKCNGNCTKDEFNAHQEHALNCPQQVILDNKWLFDCGLDKKTIDALNRPLNDNKAMLLVKDYLKDGYLKKECLTLSSGTGTGKTVAAGFLLKSIKVGSYVYAPSLPKLFLNDEEFRKLRKTRFLVMDDIGLEYRKDWFFSNFDALLHHRHGNYLPTVITTNLSGAKFEGIYSKRILSRMTEWGKFIQFKDRDLRKARLDRV